MLFTPSTFPTAARPLFQSTTTGHLKLFGAFSADLARFSAAASPSSEEEELLEALEGCAETKDESGTDAYSAMVESWSDVGTSSATSRSKSRGLLCEPAG
jgi:hypothetical protein